MNKIYKDKKVINIIDDYQDLKFDLQDSQMLVINCFFNSVNNMTINVKQYDNSYLVINYAGYVKKEANVNLNVDVLGHNNQTVIKVRTINEMNHAEIKASVKVHEKTIDNEVIEDLKALNEEGNITLLPILQIDTNEVQAEHYATIGGFDDQELFYLESKGLSTIMAKEILKKSFVNSLFSDNFLKMINDGGDNDE